MRITISLSASLFCLFYLSVLKKSPPGWTRRALITVVNNYNLVVERSSTTIEHIGNQVSKISNIYLPGSIDIS